MSDYGVFSYFVLSFYNRKFYQRIIAEFSSRAVMYVFLLAFCIIVPITVKAHISMKEFIDTELIYMIGQLPELTIEDGIIVDGPTEPMTITASDGSAIVRIDIGAESLATADMAGATVLVLRDRILYNKSLTEQRVYNLGSIETFVLDQAVVTGWLGWYPMFFAIVFFFVYLWAAAVLFIQAAINGLVALMISQNIGLDLKYGQVYGLAIVAATPALALKFFLGLVSFTVPFLWLLCFGISVFTMVFGLRQFKAGLTTVAE